MTRALETLVAELASEGQWLAELRADADRTARKCHRLLTAIEATMQAMPRDDRRPYWVQFRRLQSGLIGRGRPPRDGRQQAILDFLVEQGGGTFTNGEVRQHLMRAGLRAQPKYVSNQLGAYVAQEVLTRLGHGLYRINPASRELQLARFRLDRAASVEALKGEIDTMTRSGDDPRA